VKSTNVKNSKGLFVLLPFGPAALFILDSFLINDVFILVPHKDCLFLSMFMPKWYQKYQLYL